jgi:CelD/BcsL family acetyltransferase involved in cellulose biosynthesis
MSVEQIDPIRDDRWHRFVEGRRDATIFHHPAWLGLLQRQYGYDMSACCDVDDGGAIRAGLPLARISGVRGRRLIALPFSDFCPPLVAEDRGGSRRQLVEALALERRRTGAHIAIHAPVPELPDAGLGEVFYRHTLALAADPADVEKRFTRSQVRRGIAKARREGVVARRATDEAALSAFFSLHAQTRRRQGVPTQPKRFVLRLASLFAQGLGFVMVAEHHGRPIAAAVFLTCNGTLTYKYGASDVRHLALRPNNLLFSEAIRQGCHSGAHTLDFGRTDLDNEGLRAFKLSWGSHEERLAYTSTSADRKSRGAAARRLAARAGAAVIRRSPPVVSRMVGAALYKYAA